MPEGRQLPRLVFINVAIRAIGKKEAITELPYGRLGGAFGYAEAAELMKMLQISS